MNTQTGWYSIEGSFIAVLGPISLKVTRKGALWQGEVRTGSDTSSVVLKQSGRYRNVLSAQRVTQELAMEVLQTTAELLHDLQSSVMQLPKA